MSTTYVIKINHVFSSPFWYIYLSLYQVLLLDLSNKANPLQYFNHFFRHFLFYQGESFTIFQSFFSVISYFINFGLELTFSSIKTIWTFTVGSWKAFNLLDVCNRKPVHWLTVKIIEYHISWEHSMNLLVHTLVCHCNIDRLIAIIDIYLLFEKVAFCNDLKPMS